MIQLRPDYLQFQTADGELLPCSAEQVSVELLGEACYQVDPVMVQHAAEAVLHFFKNDLGRESVSVGEFSEALEKVLRGMGVMVTSATHNEPCGEVSETSLLEMARGTGSGYELAFFKNLQEALRQKLAKPFRVIAFKGLRPSVKFLLGAKRWNPQCQQLHDQIVGYLRQCYKGSALSRNSTLVIQ